MTLQLVKTIVMEELTRMILKVGDKAPHFTLKTMGSEGLLDVDIAGEIGKKKIVILFFPLAFTSVCTGELCSVTNSLNDYAALDAEVFAISVDSPFAQDAFAKKNGIKVTLLSDFNKEVSEKYGVLFPELMGLKGVAKRAAFVIGMDGKILHAEASDDPAKLPDFETIQKILRG